MLDRIEFEDKLEFQNSTHEFVLTHIDVAETKISSLKKFPYSDDHHQNNSWGTDRRSMNCHRAECALGWQVRTVEILSCNLGQGKGSKGRKRGNKKGEQRRQRKIKLGLDPHRGRCLSEGQHDRQLDRWWRECSAETAIFQYLETRSTQCIFLGVKKGEKKRGARSCFTDDERERIISWKLMHPMLIQHRRR